MTIHQFLSILRARWLFTLGVFAATVGTGLTASLLLPKTYTASTAVVVDVTSADPIAGVPAQFLPGYMATQVDIISSERMARRVVKVLKLDQVPTLQERWRNSTGGRGTFEQWMAVALQKKLDVVPSRDSSVINIRFSGPDPQFVSTVANAFAQAYIDISVELRVEPATQYAAWFDARATQLRARLEQAQEALSAYQRDKGIVAADEGVDYETRRLNEISSQLTQIQALRADTSSRKEQAGAGNDYVQEVLQNPLISSLKSDLVRAEAKWQDAQLRLGPNHPDYLKAQSEVGSLQERIALETRRVASSLASANQVNVQREAELRALLDAQKRKVLQLNEARDGITVLQRNVEGAQKAYDAVSQRLAQTNLESQIQRTNLAVLTPAESPVEPSSPNVLLNTLIAICLGTVLGVGTALLRELRQRRVRSVEDLTETLAVLIVDAGRPDVETTLDIPVLASLPARH
jgi:chain length determinant protein EpsF